MKEEQRPMFIPRPQHQPHRRSEHLHHWLEGPCSHEEELILFLWAGLMLVSLLQGLTKTGANYKSLASSEDMSAGNRKKTIRLLSGGHQAYRW